MAIFRHPADASAPLDQAQAHPEHLPFDQGDYVGLIMTLGRALLSLGSPAHRVEGALELMSQRLGLQAQFLCTPTSLIVALGEGQQQKTYLARITAVSTDLGKLAEIAEVISALEQRQIWPQQAAKQVEAIYEAPPRFGRGLSFMAFLLVAMPATMLLGGGLQEVKLAAVLSAVVGFLAIFAAGGAWGRLLVPLSATLSAFLATLWCGYDGQTALMPALIAGMIVLLPGLDLTTATRELSTGHLVSGGARLAATTLVFATLAFGLALGSAIGQSVVGPTPEVSPQPVPMWAISASLLLAAVGLALILRVRVREWIWVAIACAIAWASGQLGFWTLGGSLGAFVGGALVGLSGNAYARLTSLPGSTLHIPGLLLLVPGSVGMRSMAALLGADVLTGIEVAFAAVLTAVALATGMIVASVLLPPRNEL